MSLAAECGFKLKFWRTRKRAFLSQMQQVMPWRELEAVIAPYAKTTGPRGGRPPFAVSTMLRIYFLQQGFGRSDPATGVDDALKQTLGLG